MDIPNPQFVSELDPKKKATTLHRENETPTLRIGELRKRWTPLPIAFAFSIFVFAISLGGSAAAQQSKRLSDNDLLHAIEGEFQFNDSLSPDTMDATVQSGVVTLTGEVPTLLAQRQAERIVGSLRGVRAVINELTVFPTGMSNEELASSVQKALQNRATSRFSQLSTRVDKDGLVIVDGKISSVANRQLLETLIADVRGVTGIQDNTVVTEALSSRSPDEIRAEIARRYELSPFLDESQIEISIIGRRVQLTGSVGSVNERTLANRLAWIGGVDSVDDSGLLVDVARSLKARGKKFQSLKNDLQITKDVTDAILYNPRVRSSNIQISSKLAGVTLRGTVTSLDAKRAAEETAEGTLGVRRVINNLKVKMLDWPGDEAITKAAEAALDRDARLSGLDLQTSSHFGKLYADGRVNSQRDRERVAYVLANVAGVRAVVNRVTLASDWNEKPDSEIFEDTQVRLRWSPHLDPDAIIIDVEDGIVTLTGTVDTWQDKAAAKRHAQQGGARKVKNLLRVRQGRNLPDGIASMQLQGVETS